MSHAKVEEETAIGPHVKVEDIARPQHGAEFGSSPLAQHEGEAVTPLTHVARLHHKERVGILLRELAAEGVCWDVAEDALLFSPVVVPAQVEDVHFPSGEGQGHERAVNLVGKTVIPIVVGGVPKPAKEAAE